MTKINRRGFTAFAWAGVAGMFVLRAAKPGVISGEQSYSFRNLALNEALAALQQGADTVTEVQKCVAYCQKQVA